MHRAAVVAAGDRVRSAILGPEGLTAPQENLLRLGLAAVVVADRGIRMVVTVVLDSCAFIALVPILSTDL